MRDLVGTRFSRAGVLVRPRSSGAGEYFPASGEAATASRAGVPRAATLTYVNEGVALYVWTRPETTTARHIEQNPFVSFAIDEYAADWRETRGIQGAGEAQIACV